MGLYNQDFNATSTPKQEESIWSKLAGWFTDPKSKEPSGEKWQGYGPLKDDPKFFTREDWDKNPQNHPTVEPRWQSWFGSDGFTSMDEPSAEAATPPSDFLEEIDPQAFQQGFQNAYAQQMAKLRGSRQPAAPILASDDEQVPMGASVQLPEKEINWKPALALADAWADKPSNLAGAYNAPMSNEERELLRIKMEEDIAQREAQKQAQAMQQAALMQRAQQDLDNRKDIAMMNNLTRVEVAKMKPAKSQPKLNPYTFSNSMIKRHELDLMSLGSAADKTPEQVHQIILEEAMKSDNPEKRYTQLIADELKVANSR